VDGDMQIFGVVTNFERLGEGRGHKFDLFCGSYKSMALNVNCYIQ